MYILNIVITIKRMAVKELKDFIFKNYYQRMQLLFRIQLLFNETSEKRIYKFCNKINRKNT